MLFSGDSCCEYKISKNSLLRCAILSKRISKSIDGIISLPSSEVRNSIDTYLNYQVQKVKEFVGLNINISELKELLINLLKNKKYIPYDINILLEQANQLFSYFGDKVEFVGIFETLCNKNCIEKNRTNLLVSLDFNNSLDLGKYNEFELKRIISKKYFSSNLFLDILPKEGIFILPIHNIISGGDDNKFLGYLVLKSKNNLYNYSESLLYRKYQFILSLFYYIYLDWLKEYFSSKLRTYTIGGVFDDLTSLLRRDFFFMELEKEINTSNKELGFIILDIDDFKHVNDSFGHQIGDEVLMLFGKAVQSSVRKSIDLVGRYGGEEFSIGYIGNSIDSLLNLAIRITYRIHDKFNFFLKENASIPDEIKNKGISFSAGVSFISEIEGKKNPIFNLIKLADRRLYKSKLSGKSRLILPNNKVYIFKS